MRASFRHLLAASLVLAFAAEPAAAQSESPPVNVDLLGLEPVGDSPLSGLAYLRERPGRLRAHVAIANARDPIPTESVTLSFSSAPCGDEDGKTVEVVARHVDGRGLEYIDTGATAGIRAQSLGYVEDENADGDFDDRGETKACGRVRRVRGEGSVAELRPVAGSEISGLAVASRRSGRIDVRVVLTMLNNKNPELTRVVATRGRCGAPAGRTFELFAETDEYDLLENIRTPSDVQVTKRSRSLRIMGDWDGDGTVGVAACGLMVTTSDIDAN